MKIFRKILVANRGEIAVRVFRSAKNLGITTVAVYSEVDSDSLHVAYADEAYCIGKSDLSETYLNINKIVDLALRTNCDAIHPGYGFLAENPVFMRACEKAGIIFIGPNEKSIHIMGNKIESRDFVRKLNVPLTEGITGDVGSLIKASKDIAFPLLVKAAAGGGGKGMRIVHSEKDLKDAIESTSREAKSYFGDETVYIEKFIENPRHIEFQVLGDNYGNVVHVFERECSIQRRYQKIVEEAPSVTLTPEVRNAMGECAVKIASEIGYNSVGTIEFLVDKDLNFYFLEMNTRIQVEHPVTEMTTNIDLIEEQILVAAGNELRFSQSDIAQYGHAIECRVYAEDPSNNFLPSPGKMLLYREPESFDVRLDTGITENTEIKSFFDPMISKLIVWGETREQARMQMVGALKEYIIHGIKTNIPFLINVMNDKNYIDNNISTKYCDNHLEELNAKVQEDYNAIDSKIPMLGYLLHSITMQRTDYSFDVQDIWVEIGYWRTYLATTVKYKESEFEIEIIRKNKGYEFVLDGELFDMRINDIENDRILFSMNDSYYKIYISEDNGCNAFVNYDGHTFNFRRKDLLSDEFLASDHDAAGSAKHVSAPMPGKVLKISVSEGTEVKKGDLLLIIESMKMENRVVAHKDAIIESISCGEGDMVDSNTPIIIFQE